MTMTRMAPAIRSASWRQGYAASRCYPALHGDAAHAPGTLVRLDRFLVQAGSLIPMHAERDEEIVTIIHSGRLLYLDNFGHERPLAPGDAMSLGAGRGVERELRALGPDPAGGIEIGFRPSSRDLAPRVRFAGSEIAATEGAWRLLAAPGGAPLPIRCPAQVHSAAMARGEDLALPGDKKAPVSRYLYVMGGAVGVAGEMLKAGECAELSGLTPSLGAVSGARLLLVTTDRAPDRSGSVPDSTTASSPFAV